MQKEQKWHTMVELTKIILTQVLSIKGISNMQNQLQ